jgi:hypothetical protein
MKLPYLNSNEGIQGKNDHVKALGFQVKSKM